MSAVLQYVTPPVVAKRLGIGTQKVIAYIRSGKLRAYDFRSDGSNRPLFKIREADLRAFEESRVVAPVATNGRRRRARQAAKRYF
jgi:Helix-turn-helix domain